MEGGWRGRGTALISAEEPLLRGKGLAFMGNWCLLLSAILTLKSQVTVGEIHPSCPSLFPMKTSHLPLALNYAISNRAIGSNPKPGTCG